MRPFSFVVPAAGQFSGSFLGHFSGVPVGLPCLVALGLCWSVLSGPLGGVAQAAACTPTQERQAAQAAARAQAQQQLATATVVYRLMYDHVSYDIKVGQANIQGNTATVPGSVILRGTERRTGKPGQGQYPGTVSLKRTGSCRWVVTGYRRG